MKSKRMVWNWIELVGMDQAEMRWNELELVRMARDVLESVGTVNMGWNVLEWDDWV